MVVCPNCIKITLPTSSAWIQSPCICNLVCIFLISSNYSIFHCRIKHVLPLSTLPHLPRLWYQYRWRWLHHFIISAALCSHPHSPAADTRLNLLGPCLHALHPPSSRPIITQVLRIVSGPKIAKAASSSATAGPAQTVVRHGLLLNHLISLLNSLQLQVPSD